MALTFDAVPVVENVIGASTESWAMPVDEAQNTASMQTTATDLQNRAAGVFRTVRCSGRTTEVLYDCPAADGESIRDRDMVNAPSLDKPSNEIVE